MNEQQVFINFVPQDLETANQIREKLEAENISCYMLPAVDDMETHFKVVQQIESMIDAKGAIVTIVSREALKNNWIISNAQYSCELAGRRTMLVIYQIEEIPQNNPLALYYAQAVVINASRKTDTSFSKLVNNAKRILQRIDVPDTFRPRRIPQKIIKRIVVITAVLGMLLGIGNYFLQMISEANRNLPQVIATPVVFDDPFSGESLDQGIIIDRRYVPESMPPGNPQAEAPFHFQPEYIYKRFSFDDPALENVNPIDEGGYSGSITLADQYIIRQTNGVLQYAVAPQINGGVGNSGFHSTWFFNHLIQTGDFEYMGLRFRIDDYQGWWSDENNLNMAYFDLGYS
ncbi:MAG: toll/interleukin-1 receptor domain-containing protein, partial [Anaerolineaceae bacterium]|nr:toll/interleukin-1 receptor domain-containing protein [Anaerolineaceae bacterium]